MKENECLKNIEFSDLKFSYELKKELKQLVHMDYLCTWIGVPK